jgi:ABC-type multidrug transport system fused ATPase/permease subunit
MLLNLLLKKSNYKILKLKDLLFIFSIVLLSLLSVLLEGLSISAIPLFFNSLFNNLNIDNFVINFLFEYITKINTNNLSIIFLFIISFFFFKSLFLYFLSIIEFIFLKRFRLKILKNLIDKFLDKNLNNNNKESSATKIWKIELVNNFSYIILNYISFIKNILYLFITIFFVIFFTAIEFIYPLLFLLVLILTFYIIFKKKIINTGKNIAKLTDTKNNIIQNLFEGLKTVIIFQKQAYFKKLFNNASKEVEKNQQSNHFILSFPTVFLDFFAVLIIFIIYQMYLRENSPENLIYILSLITYGFMKIISILKTLNQNFLNIKKNSYSISVLLKELEIKNLPFKIKLARFNSDENIKNIIEIKNLKFNFNINKNIFNELSFNFKRNFFYGIFGESGSGKSTFLDIICGINNFKSGQVDVFCNRDKISYVPQECFIMQENIKKTIAFGEDEEQINIKKVQNSILQSQMSAFINKLPKGIDFQLYQSGRNISVGQKQRLGIARSLYISPQLLIMDEPTSSLDNETEINLINVLQNLKKDITIIMTTHKLSLKKYFDISLIIKNKKISKF